MRTHLLFLPLALLGCKATPTHTDSDAVPSGHTGSELPARVEGAIRADDYPRWVFEIDAVSGRELDPATGPGIAAVLSELVDKPDGIAFVADGAIEGRLLWDDATLQQVADEAFDDAAPEGTFSSHLMLLNGSYTQGDVLGLAWGHTHVALFTDVIERACTEGPGDPARICPTSERLILLHEIGHLLGLVGVGLPKVGEHEDPEHPGHDVDPDCLMYWAYEGSGIVQQVRNQGQNEPDLGFDDACQADLAAARQAL